MKTKSLVLILSLGLMITAVQAQDAAFGLKGGINLSTFNLDDANATYDSRTGFHAGLFVRGKFNKVAIQPELLLFTQNSELRTSLFGTAQDRFTYLSIPVMVKLYPVGGLNLQLGPQFGFLIDGERKYDTVFGSGSQDIKDHYKSSDVSLSLGAGYDFGFGLGLDFRYNLGLKDVNNAANGEAVKSRVFLVSLGWNFLN
ncbi:MAG TPA: porin family protein [Chryseosolibacter sp.]